MMDSTMPTSNSDQEFAEEKDELQCKIIENQNNQEIEESKDLYSPPVPEIEAPLSPVLTNSKKSLRHITRRKLRIKLMSKFSQNSSTSQDFTPLETQTQVEEEEQISSTDNLKLSVETSTIIAEQNASEEINECSELETRMKRCIEIQRSKKFCYNIATSSSKVSENLESCDTSVNSNFKIIDSPLSENKNYGSFKTIESFISNVKVTDCKAENDFNFKIPESPASVSKLKRNRTDILTTNLETNMKVGFETGSGKKIKLSEKALKRASKLFDDIIDIPCDALNISSSNSKNLEDKNTETNFNNNENISNLGFQTASGNSLKLTETSVYKIKTLFDDIYDLSNYKEIQVENDLKICTDTDVNLSETSNQNESKKLNQLFSIESELNTKKSNETQFKTPMQPVDNKSSNKENEGMSPNSKNLPFTQITDTQMCWAAENAECMAEFMNSQWTSPKNKSFQCQKTQQSNEKNIIKTQEEHDGFSSPESEQLFGNLTVREDGTVATRNLNRLDKIESSVDKNSDMPFATKSEKEVTISEESLTNAGNMFQDYDIVENINDKNNISESIRTVGFATASGKRVTLSEESLNNAKNMFQDCFNESNSDILESVAADDFSLVSGKEVALGITKNIFTTDVNLEDNIDNNIDILPSIKENTRSDQPWRKDNNMFLDSMNEENLNLNIEFPTSALFEAIPENIAPISAEVQAEAKTKFEDTIETNKDMSEQSIEREQKYDEPVQSGFLTASGNKIVISQDLLNKVRNIFEDNLDLFTENPEEQMQFDFVTPSTSIVIPEDYLSNTKNNLESSETKEILPELLTDNKHIINSAPNVDNEKDSNCSDCCGFTWDESLKSLKIYELYKRSFKYIEKGIKTNVIYPLSFTFDHIQSSKEYKNKNYKYAFRSRKKSSVVYGSNKRKSTRGQHKSINNSPTLELLNTSSIITRSKRNFTTEEDIVTSISSLSKTRSRTRRSKDNASNKSSISSISNKTDKTDKTSIGNKSSKNSKSNSQKSRESLEDAFLSCIENTLKDINSQGTSATTESFFSTDDINSLKEEFSEETNFDILEQNSSDFHTPLGHQINASGETLTKTSSVTDCDILEKTNIIMNPSENVMDSRFSTTTENKLEVEKHIFNECEQELENKITVIASLKETKNMCGDTEKENINNYNTPKTDLKFGFPTASGKKMTVNDENLNKDNLNINLNTSQTETIIDSKQNCDILEKNIESPINTLNYNFSTVSDKEVEVSNKSIKKSGNIFQDIDAEHSVYKVETPQNLSSIVFITASEKKVSISEEALMKVRNIFQDCDIIEESDRNIDTPKTMSFGFVTASGKKVTISEESLKNAKNIFQDCDITKECLDTNIDTPKNATSVGFATASGKKVAISEDSLKKVKNIFQDCDTSEENLDTNIDTSRPVTPFGFATASGKKVTVSEDSLKKVKNVFQDCDISKENLDTNIDTSRPVTPLGFATASGKKVTVSEDSLKKVKNVFQDCDISKENLDTNIDTSRPVTPLGFATASGKKVTVSEDSLKKVKNVFQDCDISKENLDTNIDTSRPVTPFGFATASGKKVTVSEDSLKKVKNVFQDCDISKENLDTNIDTSRPVTPLGFAKASGKKVGISEDSFNKVKNIFQDCDIDKENIDTSSTVTSFGFATASGKKVGISEDSLKKVKNIFQDCDIAEENLDTNIDTSKTVTSFGFATASGKKVGISDDSLKRVKNIFQDCDIVEENLDTKINTSKTAKPVGFSTAFGRKVALSEETREKTNETDIEQIFAEHKHEFEESFSTPVTSMKYGFSSASGNKVIISEEALNKVRNIFEVNADSHEIIHEEETKFDSTVSINVAEKSLKRTRSISESCAENRSTLNMKKKDSISEQKFDSIPISKSIIIQRTNSSPVVTANKSYSSPQISTNDSTPILRNRTLSARNSKKRSLGVTSCRQIDIPEISMKRAKLVFDDVDSPKKTETTINNNHLQNYSPLANKTNILQNVTSRSTPNISTENKSLLNSTITIKESNQQKIAQSVATPKISPLKRLSLGNENLLENSSFVFQKETSGDLKKWKIDLQKELEMLKLKMSVTETRMQLLNKQQEITETGSSDHRRQRLGCLFAQKLNCPNRISLKEAVKNRRPEKNTHQMCLNIGVDPSLLDITADNSSTLHFHVPWWPNDNRTYPAVIRTEDGACVVPNQQNFIGVSELETAFHAMQGIDPSLVPKKWVTNHYRWIVWKLASLERNYPDRFKNCLTVESVISQLKYRYDREIDRAERPALRKIVECDDTAAKRMVLCVATIIKLENNRNELELTDGWYSIKTMLDAPLNSLVETNVIKVGLKLMTQGAELQNCEGCCPLQLPSSVRLKIHYNSTRRAAWYTKLGYQPNPGPLRISLHMVAGNGGSVGGVRAYIARIYPISYMERCDESIIWRNQRAEIRRANQWENAYSNTMETMQMIVQQELEQEWMKEQNENKRLKIKDVKGVLCGETLYQFMEGSNDPESVKELLTSEQISVLQNYQSQLNNERQVELSSRLQEKLSTANIKPRNVSTVLKLLLVDVQKSYHYRMFSVWRPTETHTQLLKEGLVINIYNVAAKNNGTLSSIPRTQFEVDSDFDTSEFENMSRYIIPISQTANSELKPQFGEFDTIGMVVKIDMQQTAQTLWIADEKYRFLLVKIRHGPNTCCLLDGITSGKIIAVMNLIHQKPFNCYGQAVANQYTVLSSYPQQSYLQEFMKEFIENISDTENVEQYLEECKNRIEKFSSQNLKLGFNLNPLNVVDTEEKRAAFYKKLCGSTQQNKSDSLTLSDEEMALIDSQAM